MNIILMIKVNILVLIKMVLKIPLIMLTIELRMVEI